MSGVIWVKLLEKNLTGTGFTFYPDPYPQQNLFYRSDNATLARLGVPAHTISTSKMDSEKYYHTRGDEIGTLDMANMAQDHQSDSDQLDLDRGREGCAVAGRCDAVAVGGGMR